MAKKIIKKLSISKKQVKILIDKENFSSDVIILKINGKEFNVLPREITFDTISDDPIHIDFLRIVKGSKINLDIPVKFINNDKSPGLKRGGVLNIVRRKVELSCPTENIPKEIIVDLDNLDIGASIKISSVNLPENVNQLLKIEILLLQQLLHLQLLKSQKNQQRHLTEGAENQEASSEGAEGATDDKSKAETDADKNKDGAKKDDQKASTEKK